MNCHMSLKNGRDAVSYFYFKLFCSVTKKTPILYVQYVLSQQQRAVKLTGSCIFATYKIVEVNLV